MTITEIRTPEYCLKITESNAEILPDDIILTILQFVPPTLAVSLVSKSFCKMQNLLLVKIVKEKIAYKEPRQMFTKLNLIVKTIDYYCDRNEQTGIHIPNGDAKKLKSKYKDKICVIMHPGFNISSFSSYEAINRLIDTFKSDYTKSFKDVPVTYNPYMGEY